MERCRSFFLHQPSVRDDPCRRITGHCRIIFLRPEGDPKKTSNYLNSSVFLIPISINDYAVSVSALADNEDWRQIPPSEMATDYLFNYINLIITNPKYFCSFAYKFNRVSGSGRDMPFLTLIKKIYNLLTSLFSITP